MPYKQYTSTYGNPASKENKKRGHKIGYCAGVKVVCLHDIVEKNKHWVAAGELVSSLRKEEVTDSGSDPESEDEMTNRSNDLLEARSKSEAKTLNNPFLAILTKYSAGKEQGQRKSARKESNASASSSVSIRHTKTKKKQVASPNQTPKKKIGVQEDKTPIPSQKGDADECAGRGRRPLAATVVESSAKAWAKFLDKERQEEVFGNDVIGPMQRCPARWATTLGLQASAAASPAKRAELDVLRKRVQFMETCLKLAMIFSSGGPDRASEFLRGWNTNIAFA